MEPSSFNLRHLQAVAAIGRTRSISAAAREVNLTQPAITQGIAKLEQSIGLPLFDRRSTGMEPTEAGLALIPRAEAALRLIASSRVTAPQMRAFTALARHGSYDVAAAALGIRGSSLHRAVSDLSHALGQQLVERRGRGIALTARGRAVARRFRLAEAELRSAAAELASFRGREVERITIGAMPLARARILPNAVAQFIRAYPAVELSIVEGSFAELVSPLRDGEIDLLVGTIRDTRIASDLVEEPLFLDRPVILARPGHALASRPQPLSAGELAAHGWIVPPEGAPLRNEWRQMFVRGGVEPPRVTVECGAVIMVRQLLVQTDFLTLLSPDQVAVELEAGWLESLGAAPGDPTRVVGLITRDGWRPTRLQHAFLAAVRAEARNIGAPLD